MRNRSQRIACRVILLLLAVLLVVIPTELSAAVSAAVSAASSDVAAESSHCCPDQPSEDGEDCCDTDGGMCCGASVFALNIAPAQRSQRLHPLPSERVSLPTHLLLPLANGPPPTPPPIS